MPTPSPVLAARFPHLFRAERHVFIVTYGRSGSTLIQTLLNRLPGACIRGENANFLPYLAQAASAVARSESIATLRRAAETTAPDNPWYGGELIDPAHIRLALADLFVRDILHPPPACRILGFKEIRFHAFPGDRMAAFHFMAECFPGAHFIVNTRDHAATARSGWWKNLAFADVDRELTEAETLYDQLAAAYPDRTLKLHYDDYARQPEALRPLFDFLNEDFDPELVRTTLSGRLSHSGIGPPS